MQNKTKIAIIGTGFGGTYTLRYLHKVFCDKKNKGREVHISVIGEKNYFLFTPLLHEVATGGVHVSNVTEPIRNVLGCCLDNFYQGRAEEINTTERWVSVSGKRVDYDYLVLSPGMETNFYDIPGAKEYSFPLKTLPDAIKIKNHCISQMEKASQVEDEEERRTMLRFVIIGGGSTGVELAGELLEFVQDTFAYYYSKKLIGDVSVILVHRGSELLPQFGPTLREKSLKILRAKGVKVLLNTGVTKISKGSILLQNGEEMLTENILWAAGIKPVNLAFDTEIKKLEDGKLVVNEFLQLESATGTLPNVFALGDVVAFKTEDGTYAPALAQIAVREAKQVARNISLSVFGKNLEKYNFKFDGNLISLGQWSALGEVHHLTFGGKFTWWLWRSVYLFKVISWRKRLIIAIDWAVNMLFPRDISQV